MTKRNELKTFAQVNGLQIKADRQRIVTAYNPKTNWVDCFESWDEAYAFFMSAVNAYRDNLTPYPWARAK